RNGRGREALADAGAADAEPVLRPEEGAVRAAQQVIAAAVEEPVGQPVERRADMRAGIDIGAEIAAAADDEHRDLLGAFAEAKAAALALRHLVRPAQENP